ILDPDGATLDSAEFAQPLHQSGNPCALGCRRARAHEPDGRQLARLLRAHRERPRRRAAQQRDELEPFHSITSPTKGISRAGISMSSGLAVLRLITNSNLVSCWTDRSAGLSPLRMRPV